MKNHKLIMENWRGFLMEEGEPETAHSKFTLDTPEGIQALIEAYREKSLSKEEAPKVDKKWFKKDPKEKVADDLEVTGLFDTKEGKAVYKYNGDKYEAEVFNYFLKDPKLQPFRGDFNTPAGSDASRADLDFYLPYGDEGERVGPIKVEMKLNPKAQLGGSSTMVGLTGNVEKPELSLSLAAAAGFDPERVRAAVEPMLKEQIEAIAKIPALLEEQLKLQYEEIFRDKTESLKTILEELKPLTPGAVDEINELAIAIDEYSVSKQAEILEEINDANKIFPLTTSVRAWRLVKPQISGLIGGNVKELNAQEFLTPHYSNKNVHYIQIGNVKKYNADSNEGEPNKSTLSSPILYGLYIIGDEDPYNLAKVGVPKLSAVMDKFDIGYQLEIRPGAAGSKEAKWCQDLVKEVCAKPPGDAKDYKLRTVGLRIQGRFYRKPKTKGNNTGESVIAEESDENEAIEKEIGNSAEEQTVEINALVQSNLQDILKIGDEIEKIRQEINPQNKTPHKEQNDQDIDQKQ